MHQVRSLQVLAMGIVTVGPVLEGDRGFLFELDGSLSAPKRTQAAQEERDRLFWDGLGRQISLDGKHLDLPSQKRQAFRLCVTTYVSLTPSGRS